MVLPTKNPTKSYWIEAAGSSLRDTRTTDNLPQETDVIIVGSGYTGASTAYWIHKVNPPVSTWRTDSKSECRILRGMAVHPAC